MKWLTLSCLLGLALAIGNAQAQMRGERGGGPPQAGHSEEVRGSAGQQPRVVHESPRPEIVRPPSGAMHTLPSVRERPPVVRTGSRPAFVQPRQNFVGGQREFRRLPHETAFHQGNRVGDFRGHRFFNHRGHGSNFVIVYVNGVACWYPFYTAFPYYYDYYDAAPTYDNGYYDSGADNTPYVDEGAGGGAVQTAPSYGDLGQEWGQDLRREVATWDGFVDYLRTYIIVAAPEAQAEFREAFIASYGINGAAAYDKAAQEAAQPAPQDPKVINVSPAN
ncbi:MAG TPA: hypothetical protein VL486_01970 [Verrucomicrobiae bacterium]|nr:hypothetical protein [Verrucomicrobiae bacterium]